jgi:hypothetical protein
MRLAIVAILAALTSACVPMATGGAGTTASGLPIAGELMRDPASQTFTMSVVSPAGWACSSNFPFVAYNPQNPSMIRTVPLACNNGASGQMVLTGNQFQNQMVGSFQLSNGERGQVTFGNT